MAKGHARHRGGNRWQLEVDLGSYVDPATGERKRNRKYKTIKAKSQSEANIELAKFVVKVTDSDYYEPEKMHFVDFVKNEWLPKCAKKRLSHTTLASHVSYLETRILPAFQYLRLDQIKPIHITDFLHNLEEEGMRLDKKKDKDGNLITNEGKLSSSTIFYHYRILNNIFNYAVEIRLIEKSPLKGVKKPSVEYKEVEPYTLNEAVRVIEALDKELLHWRVAIKLAIMNGLRRSELYAVDLHKHVDIENKILKVRNALTYTKDSGFQIHEIKKGSRRAKIRDIVIPDSLIKPLEDLIFQRKKERFANKKNLWRNGEHCLLLCHPNGEPYNPSSMRNWWKRFLKRHNLRYINIHALRHTMVNLLIEMDVPLPAISKRAGHSGIGITSDTYGHRIQTVDELASTKLDDALFRHNKTQ